MQRKQHGDLIALLSADGREVEILEVLMQAAQITDGFGNFGAAEWHRSCDIG